MTSSVSFAWSAHDQSLYDQRRFIELTHVLVMQKKLGLAKKILEQEKDLSGCRQIHAGFGNLLSLLDCVHFINREDELKLKSSKRTSLLSDINVLCGKFASRPESLTKILGSKIFMAKHWVKCREFTWRQVYLTVYANFDADPVGSLGLLRKAQEALGSRSPWAIKALSLFETKLDGN